jgi:hypothetical protein
VHFEKGNKERIRKLTTKAAGYHGANAAISSNASTSGETLPTTILKDNPSQDTAAAATTLTANTASIRTNSNVTMYYCWTHGLGKNQAHTSATCTGQREGHQSSATANKMMNGNNRIMSGDRAPRPSKN